MGHPRDGRIGSLGDVLGTNICRLGYDDLKKFKNYCLGKRLKEGIKSNKLIQKARNNLNNTKSVKYCFATEHIQWESIISREFKEGFCLHRLQKIEQDAD